MLYLGPADHEVVHPDKTGAFEINGPYPNGCPGQLFYLAARDWLKEFVADKIVDGPTNNTNN
jgi:hypothetical protein